MKMLSWSIRRELWESRSIYVAPLVVSAIVLVGFFLGLVVDFTDPLVTVIVVSMVVGSVILAPAIVFGYGVKAAERDDAEQGRPTNRGNTP